MSKAEQWAAGMNECPKLKFYNAANELELVATVSLAGGLILKQLKDGFSVLTPIQTTQLFDWLKDVFVDQEEQPYQQRGIDGV